MRNLDKSARDTAPVSQKKTSHLLLGMESLMPWDRLCLSFILWTCILVLNPDLGFQTTLTLPEWVLREPVEVQVLGKIRGAAAPSSLPGFQGVKA